METIPVVYENGVFRPIVPVALPEATTGSVSVDAAAHPANAQKTGSLDIIYELLMQGAETGIPDLAAHPGSPILICDDLTKQAYVLVPRDQFAQLQDEYVRRELQVAFDQADREEWRDLDIEGIISRAHQRNGIERGK